MRIGVFLAETSLLIIFMLASHADMILMCQCLTTPPQNREPLRVNKIYTDIIHLNKESERTIYTHTLPVTRTNNTSTPIILYTLQISRQILYITIARGEQDRLHNRCMRVIIKYAKNRSFKDLVSTL